MIDPANAPESNEDFAANGDDLDQYVSASKKKRGTAVSPHVANRLAGMSKKGSKRKKGPSGTLTILSVVSICILLAWNLIPRLPTQLLPPSNSSQPANSAQIETNPKLGPGTLVASVLEPLDAKKAVDDAANKSASAKAAVSTLNVSGESNRPTGISYFDPQHRVDDSEFFEFSKPKTPRLANQMYASGERARPAGKPAKTKKHAPVKIVATVPTTLAKVDSFNDESLPMNASSLLEDEPNPVAELPVDLPTTATAEMTTSPGGMTNSEDPATTVAKVAELQITPTTDAGSIEDDLATSDLADAAADTDVARQDVSLPNLGDEAQAPAINEILDAPEPTLPLEALAEQTAEQTVEPTLNADVKRHLDAYLAALAKLRASADDRSVSQQYYVAIAKLSEAVHAAEETQSRHPDLVRAVQEIYDDPDLLQLVSAAAVSWTHWLKRSNDGVVIAGVVERLEQSLDGVIVHVRTKDRRKSLVPVVLGPLILDDSLTGQQTVILGAIGKALGGDAARVHGLLIPRKTEER